MDTTLGNGAFSKSERVQYLQYVSAVKETKLAGNSAVSQEAVVGAGLVFPVLLNFALLIVVVLGNEKWSIGACSKLFL